MKLDASPAAATGASTPSATRLSGRLLTWSITSALAGFLFGFDTVVISGAEQTIQALWGLSAGMHGLALGAALYGTVLGSLIGGWPTDRFGRKATLTWIGILYFVSAVLSGVAGNVWIFIAARFIGGVGVGISTVAAPQHSARGFWSMRLRVPILLAFLVAFFNQLSGINAILYFAPRIFELTGLGTEAALLQSIGIGVTNLIFAFVGLWLIDRLGRRTLLYIGSFGYIASLGLCAWAFFTQHFAIVPACIFAFIAAHAVGQGTVIWVLISEIFPNQYRATGQALGSATHWVFAALLTTLFPAMVGAFAPGYIFLFFCGMMVLQLIWVMTMVPETKGVPLEEIQRQLGVVA